MNEDPFLSHEKELRARDKAYQKLQEEHRILQSQYRVAAAVLADMADAAAAADESLRRFLSPGGLDATDAFASGKQCRQALSRNVTLILGIQKYVTTEYDKVASELQACQRLNASYAAYDVWKTKLADWHMHIDNGAYVLTHLAYPLVRSVDLVEAVAVALDYQKETRGDPQFEGGFHASEGE